MGFSVKKRRLLLLIGGSIAVLVVYQQSFLFFAWTSPNLLQPPLFDTFIDWNSSLLDSVNQTCRLPILDPFDSKIYKYLRVPTPIQCKWRQPRLTLIKDGVLLFNQSALDASGYSPTSLSCYYQPITRPDGQDDVTEYGPKQPMTGRDVIRHDFIYVHCDNWWHVTVYTNIHAYPRDIYPKPIPRQGVKNKPSVLVFGIDSLSHMNAIRYLPNTYKYLTQNMGAHIMRGMTRIGDNTWPNTVAMFAGKRVYAGEIETLPLGEFYDSFPVIWRNFSLDSQYVTLYSEDWPPFNMFNHAASGFLKRPTDHYFRPFWVAAESSIMYKMSSYMCLGDRPKHLHQMQYISDFVVKYQDVPFFAFSFLSEISHNNMELVGAADEDSVSFLRHLHVNGYLNSTILFFIGDHGHRFDPLIITELGRADSNLPFSAIVLPPSIRTDFPEVVQKLRINSNRLASMFDYYETFADILHYVGGKSPLGTSRSAKAQNVYNPVSTRRLYSLFDNIPLNRTCQEAGIPPNYCPCHVTQIRLLASDERSKMAADILLTKLNTITRNYSNICAVWGLSQIKSAILLATIPNSPMQDIRIVVETNPGKALFEAIVRLTLNSKKEIGKVMDEINRVNRYKGQDSCLTSHVQQSSGLDLRKYCYCT